jgi:RHH-type proline utilization regulon transcriptional repressor/proline dehydrogenase/delta 1-pyrroline-5-carboxylate dehydrogenase
LRVLYVQEDIAETLLTMLRGALAELSVGNPDWLATDIGPVISAEARDAIEAHIAAMAKAGHPVHRPAPAPEGGTFVAPAIIELGSLAALQREVFGPVLHVLRYRRDTLDQVLADIAATGYGLTFGVHSRIDETIQRVTAHAPAGNVYVNRNLIGAVVGAQPFGGRFLSGTGPKAGGPLYLRRLLTSCPAETGLGAGTIPEPARAWADWLRAIGESATLPAAPLGITQDLPGPVGERNVYSTEPRGPVLCAAATREDLIRQITAALATGNRALAAPAALALLPTLPPNLSPWITQTTGHDNIAAALFAGADEDCLALNQTLAESPGPIIPLHTARPDGQYPLEWLVQERSISTNTAAAGGNASLLTIT